MGYFPWKLELVSNILWVTSDKYVCRGYGIGFDSGKNVIIYWADMSSSVYIDNKEKDLLILGIVTVQD